MLHNNSKEKGVTENTFFVWHKQSRYENTLIIVALKYKIKVGSDVILLDFTFQERIFSHTIVQVSNFFIPMIYLNELLSM